MRTAYKDAVWLGAMQLGKRYGCHQRADRSFSIGNYQFPVCARCTGIIISSIAACLAFPKAKLNTAVCLFLILPMAADGTLQYMKVQKSNNRRRFITGLLGGFGLTYIKLKCFRFFIQKIMEEDKNVSDKTF